MEAEQDPQYRIETLFGSHLLAKRRKSEQPLPLFSRRNLTPVVAARAATCCCRTPASSRQFPNTPPPQPLIIRTLIGCCHTLKKNEKINKRWLSLSSFESQECCLDSSRSTNASCDCWCQLCDAGLTRTGDISGYQTSLNTMAGNGEKGKNKMILMGCRLERVFLYSPHEVQIRITTRNQFLKFLLPLTATHLNSPA